MIMKKFKDNSKSRINRNIKYKGLKFNIKQLINDQSDYITQANKISLRSIKNVCNITGLPAKYKCPKTGLYYFNKDVYNHIRDLKPEETQRYIDLRNFGRNIFSFQKDY